MGNILHTVHVLDIVCIPLTPAFLLSFLLLLLLLQALPHFQVSFIETDNACDNDEEYEDAGDDEHKVEGLITFDSLCHGLFYLVCRRI